MYRKKTLRKKIDMFFEDVFYISYILFIVLTPIVAVGIFVGGLWATFVT